MAKRGRPTKEAVAGSQLALIDVDPPNSKALLKALWALKNAEEAHSAERETARVQESKLLDTLIVQVVKSQIPKKSDGSWRFMIEQVEVNIIPGKVKVKAKAAAGQEEKAEEEEEEEDDS